MQFPNIVGKTLTSLKSSHTTLAFNYCSLNSMVIYSKVSQIPLNLWRLRSTFLIDSCLIPSHVSFLFLWSLWRNRDYFADKLCVKENRSGKVFCTTSMHRWHIQLKMYFWHIDARKHVHLCVGSMCSCMCHFCPRVRVGNCTSFLRLFLWWLGLDMRSFIVCHSLRKVVHLCRDTVSTALQSGRIWYSAPSPD